MLGDVPNVTPRELSLGVTFDMLPSMPVTIYIALLSSQHHHNAFLYTPITHLTPYPQYTLTLCQWKWLACSSLTP